MYQLNNTAAHLQVAMLTFKTQLTGIVYLWKQVFNIFIVKRCSKYGVWLLVTCTAQLHSLIQVYQYSFMLLYIQTEHTYFLRSLLLVVIFNTKKGPVSSVTLLNSNGRISKLGLFTLLEFSYLNLWIVCSSLPLLNITLPLLIHNYLTHSTLAEDIILPKCQTKFLKHVIKRVILDPNYGTDCLQKFCELQKLKYCVILQEYCGSCKTIISW